jgi:hypothetical protein
MNYRKYIEEAIVANCKVKSQQLPERVKENHGNLYNGQQVSRK